MCTAGKERTAPQKAGVVQCVLKETVFAINENLCAPMHGNNTMNGGA